MIAQNIAVRTSFSKFLLVITTKPPCCCSLLSALGDSGEQGYSAPRSGGNRPERGIKYLFGPRPTIRPPRGKTAAAPKAAAPFPYLLSTASGVEPTVFRLSVSYLRALISGPLHYTRYFPAALPQAGIFFTLPELFQNRPRPLFFPL